MSNINTSLITEDPENDSISCSKPSKIIVCNCKTCRYVKNKTKNRKFKKKVKRMLNKKRRKEVGTGIVFYWA